MKHIIQSMIQPIQKIGRQAKMVLISTMIFGALDSLWQLFYNLFILSKGFEKDFLGLVNGMPNTGFLISALLAGLFARRIGNRKTLIIGLSLQIGAMGLQLILPFKGLILGCAFLSGVGLALVIVSKLPLLHKSSSEENQALIFSLNFAVYGIIGVVGNLIAGQLPTLIASLLGLPEGHALSYQIVLIVSVVIGFLAVLPILRMDETDSEHIAAQEDEHTKKPVDYKSLILSPLVIKLCLPCLTLGIGAGILLPFMNVFFVESFKTSDQLLGLLFSIRSVVAVIAGLAAPVLSRRFGGKKKVTMYGLVAGSAAVFIMGFSNELWLTVIGFQLRMFAISIAIPLFDAFSMDEMPDKDRNIITSIREVFWVFGFAVGPYFSGLTQKAYGFFPIFITSGIFFALSALLLWFFWVKTEGQSENRSLAIG